jgi:hypothetical protein
VNSGSLYLYQFCVPFLALCLSGFFFPLSYCDVLVLFYLIMFYFIIIP